MQHILKYILFFYSFILFQVSYETRKTLVDAIMKLKWTYDLGSDK